MVGAMLLEIRLHICFIDTPNKKQQSSVQFSSCHVQISSCHANITLLRAIYRCEGHLNDPPKEWNGIQQLIWVPKKNQQVVQVIFVD